MRRQHEGVTVEVEFPRFCGHQGYAVNSHANQAIRFSG